MQSTPVSSESTTTHFQFTAIVAFLTVVTALGYLLAHVARFGTLVHIAAYNGQAASQLGMNLPISINQRDVAFAALGILVALLLYFVGFLYPHVRWRLAQTGWGSIWLLWMVMNVLAHQYVFVGVAIGIWWVGGWASRKMIARLERGAAPPTAALRQSRLETLHRIGHCVGATCLSLVTTFLCTVFNSIAPVHVIVASDTTARTLLRSDSEGMLLRSADGKIAWIPAKALMEVRVAP